LFIIKIFNFRKLKFILKINKYVVIIVFVTFIIFVVSIIIVVNKIKLELFKYQKYAKD